MQLLVVVALLALASADPYESFHGVNGRNVQVQLFEWKWTDVANECETFLAKYGYGGVQVRVVLQTFLNQIQQHSGVATE